MPEEHRKGRPPELDREQIVQAARSVAVERGFDRLRFADVSSAVGVPVSSLQYAFGTRDSLVREVLRAGVRDELERLRQAVDGEPDPWRRIEKFIHASIAVDEAHRREGWLLWIEYWRAALRDPELHEDYIALARTWRGLVQRAVDEGVHLGRFTIAGSAEEVAAAIVAIVDGLGLQVEVGDTQMQSARAVRTALLSVSRILRVGGT